MTISRSKAVDFFATALALAGFVGFAVCWGIGWNAQLEVLGRAELRHPSAQRSAQIELKGVTWYVDPSFARRFNLADNLIIVFWMIGVAGGVLKERERIRVWWESRKQSR